MKTPGQVLIVLWLVVATLKLVGVGEPEATTRLMLLALVVGGTGFVLYRVNRSKQLRGRE